VSCPRYLTVVVWLILFVSTPPLSAQDNLLARAKARRHRGSPLVDGHNDYPWALRQHNEARDLNTLDIRMPQPTLMTDIPRLRAGGVGGQFWSVYIPVSIQGPQAIRATIEQIDVVHRMMGKYSDVFELARTPGDVERIFKAGRIASMVGMEGGHSIDSSLAVLRMFYEMGARSIRVSVAPVIFSHSSARALNDHPRNVPDHILRMLPKNGGVVMVTFVPEFISREVREDSDQRTAEQNRLRGLYPNDEKRVQAGLDVWRASHSQPRATLTQVADHIDHIRKTAGIDHVGLGSDFDGITSVPVGLEDVSKYPALTAELMRRGYSKADIDKVIGLNVLRVWREVERVPLRLQKTK
jgi:membrane dipeptidase